MFNPGGPAFSGRLEQDNGHEPPRVGEQLPGLTRCPRMCSQALPIPLGAVSSPPGSGGSFGARLSPVSRALMSRRIREGRGGSKGALQGRPPKPGTSRLSQRLGIHQPLEKNPRSWAVMGASHLNKQRC